MINKYSNTPLVKIPKKKGKSSVMVFDFGNLLKIETEQGIVELSIEQAIYLGGVAQNHEEKLLLEKLFNLTKSKWDYAYHNDGYDDPNRLISFGVANEKFSIQYEYHVYDKTFTIYKTNEITYDTDITEDLSSKEFKKIHDKYMRFENFR